jgi:dTDP-glucose 4,6-dehydratase
MKGLLVTGGAGFIGSNFVHHWLRRYSDTRVVVLDALTYAGKLENLKAVRSEPALRFVHGDIADQNLVEEILREEELHTIVHFAAESNVDRSIHGPDAFVYTNVLGTHSLLKAARRVWLEERAAETHRFHHVSTDEVYGSLEADDRPFHERTPYSPNSPYSASKASSDHMVRAYHNTYGLQATISHCSNNYGPHHLPEKLVPLTIVNILLGRPVPIYGNGRNVRDWVHVSDHCHAIDLILDQGVPGECYNIGGNAESENLALVRLICEIADETFRKDRRLRGKYPHSPAAMGACTAGLIKFIPDRPGHDRRYATDCGKIASELGFQARISLEDGLRDTFDWYVRNDWWWQRAMDRSYHAWIQGHYGTSATEPEAELLLLHRL